MAGGLLQLVAYGAQDLYLTGNPQITFFKIVYRRHTNFAIESRKLTFNGTPNFSSTSVCPILKGPDLLHKLYLEVKINSGKVTCTEGDYKAFRWLNWLGHILLKKVSFNIGGTEIDKHNGEWYHIANELSQKGEKAEAYAEMVGNTPYLTQIQTTNEVDTTGHSFFTSDNEAFDLYIPLQFWFCKNPGLALPIVALSHADMNLEIEFEDLENCMWGTHENATKYRNEVGNSIFSTLPSFTTTYVWADYIYLDVDERKRFAQSAHEYLIETIQIGSDKTSISSSSINYTLNFTHPVKELVWVIYPQKYRDKAYAQPRGGMQHFNYTTQWDYTGFSGTPEPHTGVGMVGGRKSQNLWYGLPAVTLPYIKTEMEPNFSEKEDEVISGTVTNTWEAGSQWRTPVNSSASGTNQQYLGYDRVKLYHVDTTQTEATGSTDRYENKNLERFVGSTSSIQNNSYETTTNNSNITIPSPYLGSWGPTETQIKLLDNGRNPVTSAKLVLNGTDRISARTGFYFNVIQPYQHHTSCPAPGINVYSFAFDPEDHQPSGTCNFSRLDNASIEVTLDSSLNNTRTSVMKVYAVSYNILRIMSGLGQLAYAS
jgi:hypothetical protein